jgi:hypothetical protein
MRAYRAAGRYIVARSKVLSILTGGPLAALRHSMPRDEFFAAIAILACANGLVARAVQTVNTVGWTDGVIGTFGISAVVWIACFTGIAELLHHKTDQIQTRDVVIGVGLLPLIILPVGHLSWMALTVLSLYILIFADDHSSRQRGAIILLATTVPMLWSRMLFNLFANVLLEIDASLVGWVLGTDRVGNMVRFADDTGYLVVFPSCSSVANISLAFLCWVTISVSFRHRWSPQDLLWCFFACASVVTVNVTRMGLMGLSQQNFEAIHSQWGDAIANVIMLGLAVGFSVLGVRREIFARA